MKQTLVLFSAALIALTTSAFAQTTTDASGEFSLQGRLTTSAGTAVADGQHTLTLKVYAQGSSAVYTETDQVTTVNGIFSTMVGDNGNGGAKLMVDANTNYELGVTVSGEAEMSPRMRIGDALKAVAADVAANANAVGGFHVDTTGVGANALITTDASGHLRSALLGSSMVTSINGLQGNVNLQLTGNGVSLDTTGGVLHLNVAGSGGGGLTFPFSSSLLNVATGDAFTVTNTLGGTSGAFINSGLGTALRAQATTGSAISATSSGTLSGAATINAQNSGGAAINAVTNASAAAALRVENTSSASTANLISGIGAGGNAVFSVSGNGQTMINSTVANALQVTTSSAGDAALRVNGGLSLSGPVGTGTIDLSAGQVVINNAYAKANSMIMLTITNASGITTAVPIRVSSQGSGSFTVSAIANAIGTLAGSYSFNYLIINQ